MPVEILANYVEIDGKQYSCSFTRDITRRREMEARMRQSEKMEAIGQLAGGVAHDFNNQLGGILGYADLLRIECADRPQLARYAEAIIATAKRSSSLNAQLLAFARQGKYLAIPVDLNKLVDEIALMLERSLNKNIMTVKILTNERAFTTGDPAQLQNALLNLAINARDAMPGGGKLIISTAVATLNEGYCSQSALSVKSGRYVKIRVADTGIGMSEDVRKRIFEPFFTTKEKGKGTGMGLASVYGTVKKHKGAIDVESRPGRGTEMTVYLPLTENAIEVETIGTSESRKPSPGARVLLIEDEEVVRKAVEQMLTMLGCRVTAVTNGNDAIALYKDSFRGYDVVFLDLIMPGMDGKETYRRLRAINPGIIAITVSGYSVDGDVEEMLKDGVKDFLQKPFGSTELSETLARVLKTTDG
jgi:nitrogen-specific signal transduction histidine kinase/CheY-like chemotaxis protein